MESLMEFTTELNEFAKNYDKEKEIIDKEDIIRAIDLSEMKQMSFYF